MLDTLAKFFFGIAVVSVGVTAVIAIVLIHLLFFGVVQGDTHMPRWTVFPPLCIMWSLMLAGFCKAIEFIIDYFCY